MNRSTSATSDFGASTATMDGDSSRRVISEPARLRLCASSPICSIWARIPVTSSGSVRERTAACRIGPITSVIQCRRVITSGP